MKIIIYRYKDSESKFRFRFRFRLIKVNGEIILNSNACKSKKQCYKKIEILKQISSMAVVVEKF